MTEIVPTILTNDISDFRKKYAELFAFHEHFKSLHVDFADGVFVETQTIMPKDVLFLARSPLYLIAKFIKKIGLVQIMSIHPGAQGREFMPEILEKIRELRALSKSVIISVDGGIKAGIARKCAEAGANILIAGSAILRAENEEAAIEALKEDIES